MNTTLAIQTREVSFSYTGDADALSSVSIRVQRGEFVALIGENGSGKTTLAKHLLGLLRPSAGTIAIEGDEIRDKPVGEIARRVGYVFQNPDHQIFSPTIREEISFGPKNLGIDAIDVGLRVEEAMQRFHLSELADRQPATTSYGIRRKVALASIYAMNPQIWILDEPTGGLDWRSEQDTFALLHEINQDGKTIVLITHDMRMVAEHAHRCIVMSKGRVVADDLTPRVLERSGELGITPPPVWRLARALQIEPRELSVESFCQVYLRQLAEEGELDVGRP